MPQANLQVVFLFLGRWGGGAERLIIKVMDPSGVQIWFQATDLALGQYFHVTLCITNMYCIVANASQFCNLY